MHSTRIHYHGNFVTDFAFIGFDAIENNKRMEELDRENEILMKPKECQNLSQTSDVSTQTVSIMLTYVDHDTKTINEDSYENDS